MCVLRVHMYHTLKSFWAIICVTSELKTKVSETCCDRIIRDVFEILFSFVLKCANTNFLCYLLPWSHPVCLKSALVLSSQLHHGIQTGLFPSRYPTNLLFTAALLCMLPVLPVLMFIILGQIPVTCCQFPLLSVQNFNKQESQNVVICRQTAKESLNIKEFNKGFKNMSTFEYLIIILRNKD
jgi:hypothetical protein